MAERRPVTTATTVMRIAERAATIAQIHRKSLERLIRRLKLRGS